jgi:hypothetical protein
LFFILAPDDTHLAPYLKVELGVGLHILTFRAVYGDGPVYLRLPILSTQRTTRAGAAPRLAYCRVKKKTAGDRAYSVVAPRLWNELPADIRSCSSIEAFKNNLRHIFLHPYSMFYKCFKITIFTSVKRCRQFTLKWCYINPFLLLLLLLLCLPKSDIWLHYVYPCQRFFTDNTLEDYDP